MKFLLKSFWVRYILAEISPRTSKFFSKFQMKPNRKILERFHLTSRKFWCAFLRELPCVGTFHFCDPHVVFPFPCLSSVPAVSTGPVQPALIFLAPSLSFTSDPLLNLSVQCILPILTVPGSSLSPTVDVPYICSLLQ